MYIQIKRASLVAQLVKNLPAMQEALVQFLVGKIPWRRDRLPTPVFMGFLGGSDSKESGRPGFDPWVGRSSGEGHGNPLQNSCLENHHGQRSLAGCNVWGYKESDMTE